MFNSILNIFNIIISSLYYNLDNKLSHIVIYNYYF